MTTSPSLTRRSKVIQYAEDFLGVHKIWEEALGVHEDYGVALERFEQAMSSLRESESLLAEFEIELQEEIRQSLLAGGEKITEAGLERAFRRERLDSEKWVQRNQEVREAKDSRDAANTEVELLKTKLRLITARIDQQGGYFAYLAAAKNATTVAKQFSDSPWS